MQLGNRRPLSPRIPRVLLLLALILATLALTHCQMVGDRLNGVGVGMFKRKDDCLAKCQSEFKDRNKAEDKLHKDNVKACGSNAACIAVEDARHQAAVGASQAQLDACQNNCHNQGGGGTGP